MIHNILHISDLHFTLEDDSYLTQNLDVFIGDLIEEIKSVESTIDYLFITGDVVERNVWKGIDSVTKMFNRLETELDVKATFCINGNHDLGASGTVSPEFTKFKSSLKLSKNTIEYSWFQATELCPKHWVIEFDCFPNGWDKTTGTGFKNLSNDQITEYLDFLELTLKEKDNTIFFLSHLPVEIDPDSELNSDAGWMNRHIWQDGKNLYMQTKKHEKISMISWFAGDGHVVDAYKSINSPRYFFLTGRFNGPIEKFGEHRDKEVSKEAHCQFIRSDSQKKEIIRTIKFSTSQEHYGQYSLKWYSKSLDFISQTKFVSKEFTSANQKKLKRKIIKTIGDQKLYSLAKATTKNKNVSLGWVDIGGLLNYSNVFQKFLDTSYSLLNLEFKHGFSECVILGMGYWGASIASFLSASLNIPAMSIKVRASSIEDLKGLQDFVQHKKLFIATDVVASGETLEYIRETLQIREIDCLLTVLLNPYIQDELIGVNKIIYGSNEISFPVLEKHNLPESIFESQFSF